MKKFCSFPRKHATNVINFEENATVNKKGLKTASRFKSMLHYWRKILKNWIMIKIMGKLGTMAILQVNIEVQHIVFAI